MAKKKSLKELTTDELQQKVADLKKEYVDKKIAIINNSFKDKSILGKLRKDTARIKTILSERDKNE